MSEAEDRRALAERTWVEITGLEPPRGEMSRMTEVSLDFVMAEVWNAPGLSRRERRLVTIATLAARAQNVQLGIHIDAAVESGDIDRETFDAFIMHMAIYGGWPTSSQISGLATQAFAARNSGDETPGQPG